MPFVNFICFNLIVLKYGLFIMSCSFQVYNKVIQLYTHVSIYSFSCFSLVGYYKILSIVPCATYSRSLLVIYFIYEVKSSHSVMSDSLWPHGL